MSISYKDLGTIFVSVDASREGARVCLEQIGPNKKRHLCRFKSTI